MFNFKEFIENLKENDEKKDIVEKYVESLPEKFEDTIIYKDYLTKFNTSNLDLLLPEYIDEDFDFELLVRLVIWSFSSSYVLEKDYIEEQMNLEILAHEDEKEKDIVLSQRANNLDKWKLTLDNLIVAKLKEEEEQEKEEKLNDLMNQL